MRSDDYGSLAADLQDLGWVRQSGLSVATKMVNGQYSAMRVAVFGATGLVGQELVQALSTDAEVSEIHVFTRRELPKMLVKVVEHRTEFSKGWESQFLTVPFDVVFCTLGTTIRQAGSQAAFRAVDYQLVLEVGAFALMTAAKKTVVVTALGADPMSKLFYNRTKGEAERDLKSLKLPGLIFVRPSLLLGNRQKSRWGEKVGEVFMNFLRPIMIGNLKKYRAIEAKSVAQAMLNLAKRKEVIDRAYESDQLQQLAQEFAENRGSV